MPEHLNHLDLTETDGAPGVRANVIAFTEPEPDLASRSSSRPYPGGNEDGRDRTGEPRQV